jgi:hypothetical protein
MGLFDISRLLRFTATIFAAMSGISPHSFEVDQWLNIVSKQPGWPYLQVDYVVCFVKRVCIQVNILVQSFGYSILIVTQAVGDGSPTNSPTHVLYISAHKQSVPDGPSFLRRSPWATLDNFVGHANERTAPQWMRWRRSSLCFTHKTISITKLFKQMASWKVNTDQVGGFVLLLVTD